jgi:hypothetical protein
MDRSALTTAIHNISARQMHDIACAIPDDRHAISSWRLQLQECVKHHQSQMIRFMAPNDLSGAEIVRRCESIIVKYSKSTWNFASSMRDIALSTEMSNDLSNDLSRELGVSVEDLRASQKRAIQTYVKAASAVCEAETRLEEKLARIDTIASQVNDLMGLDATPELAGLTEPVRIYLDSVYTRINIEEDYKTLLSSYKRFTVLRELVGLIQFESPPVPLCTICMARDVTHAVTPCGHTYCEECTRTQLTSCYICRVQIRDKMRLYFS